MSDYSDALRAHVGYLLWCFNEGYIKAEDRIGENWLLDDEGKLHPNDAALRPHLLAMADELLNAIAAEIKTGEAIPQPEPKKRLWEDATWPTETTLPSTTSAPWTPDRIANLNEFQHEGRLHPYTCANRTRETHPLREGERDWGLLVATANGWICRDCDFTQEWF